MRRLYSCLLCLAVPVATVQVFWRGLFNRAYWHGWGQRFGGGLGFASPHLWVHAASVGEVQAAAILIRALLQEPVPWRVLLTTATPTGVARARQQLGAEVVVRYGPYDLPWCIRRVLRSARPPLLIILETELWPNLLHECAAHRVPVYSVSARVSARTAGRLRKLPGLLSRAALDNLGVAAQTAADAGRFVSLGVATDAVSVCGNIKFDQPVAASTRERGVALRARYAGKRMVWVAGSTHADEERAALDAQGALRAAGSDALLVLAPRHPQRFAEVAALLQSQGLNFVRRSQAAEPLPDTSVLLLDTLGELVDFYAAADLAFVGGSLVPVGGHNLLEPVSLGVATISGAHQFNAPEVARRLLERGGLCQVADSANLSAAVVRLMADATARAQLAAAGQAASADNRGALDKILRLIRASLAQPPAQQ
jgi:3-deoxy-D-manno-octulosonic-acid transferase